MRPLPSYRDPNLFRLFSTIRSLRQAQRQDLSRTCRTWDEAQDAIDSAICDGLIENTSRHRIVLSASQRFLVPTLPNQEQ